MRRCETYITTTIQTLKLIILSAHMEPMMSSLFLAPPQVQVFIVEGANSAHSLQITIENLKCFKSQHGLL